VVCAVTGTTKRDVVRAIAPGRRDGGGYRRRDGGLWRLLRGKSSGNPGRVPDGPSGNAEWWLRLWLQLRRRLLKGRRCAAFCRKENNTTKGTRATRPLRVCVLSFPDGVCRNRSRWLPNTMKTFLYNPTHNPAAKRGAAGVCSKRQHASFFAAVKSAVIFCISSGFSRMSQHVPARIFAAESVAAWASSLFPARRNSCE
jgi:hypothetical protein